MSSGTVLITGATSSFGRAIAQRFSREGWKVIVTGRRKDRLETLVKELGGEQNALALHFDVRNEVALSAALSSLPEGFYDIDVLINNAGLALGTSPAQDCDLGCLTLRGSNSGSSVSTTVAANSTASSGSGKTSLPCRASVRQVDR